MASNGGRTGPQWQALVAWVKANYNTCYICKEPVDKTLSGRQPLGPSVDHIIPISRNGNLLDRSNARLAHTRCNTAKGNRLPSELGITLPTNAGPSRQWLAS